MTWEDVSLPIGAGDTVRLPRDQGPVELVISAPGYKARRIEVSPEADGALNAHLQRLSRRQRRGRSSAEPRKEVKANPHSIDDW